VTTESRADFARRMGWNRSSVTRAVQDGRVVLSNGLVEVEASLQKIEALASPYAHHRAHSQQLEEARHTKTPTAGAVAAAMRALAPIEATAEMVKTESREDLSYRHKHAEVLKREEDARKAKIEREALEGSLVERDAVRFTLRDHAANVKNLHDIAPDRLAPLVAPFLAPSASMDEVHAVFVEFFERMQADVHQSSVRSLDVLRRDNESA
jgi:hypothetical protein